MRSIRRCHYFLFSASLCIVSPGAALFTSTTSRVVTTNRPPRGMHALSALGGAAAAAGSGGGIDNAIVVESGSRNRSKRSNIIIGGGGTDPFGSRQRRRQGTQERKGAATALYVSYAAPDIAAASYHAIETDGGGSGSGSEADPDKVGVVQEVGFDDDDAGIATTRTTTATMAEVAEAAAAIPTQTGDGREPSSPSRILGRSLGSSPSSGSSNNSSSGRRKPEAGDIVTIHLNLVPRDGYVPEPLFDSSGTMSFVLHGGNHLPGLHDLISTMTPGESVVGAIIDAGWGERNPDLIVTLPKNKVSSSGSSGGGGGGGKGEDKEVLDYTSIHVGTKLYVANGMECTVVDVTDSDFTIDANPPLAGTTYSADVRLISVERGPLPIPYDDHNDSEPFGPNCRCQVLTIALGCFWGAELEYMRTPGVVGTKVGYTQGHDPNPSYQHVCTGQTGHAEAIQVTYDPNVVRYEDLVRMGLDRLGDSRYMLNRVRNDVGTQYRHGVYYHTKEQRSIATKVVSSYGPECKTEVLPAKVFYDAEEYHQQYLLKGGQSARKGTTEAIRCYG